MKKLIVLLVIILFFTGCAEEVEEVTPPDAVVNKYWALVQAENLDEAQKLVAEGREDIVSALDFALGEELGQAEELIEILKERISIIADGYDQDNNIALVDVTVTKPDLKQTFGTFIWKLFRKSWPWPLRVPANKKSNKKQLNYCSPLSMKQKT